MSLFLCDYSFLNEEKQNNFLTDLKSGFIINIINIFK